MKAKCIESRGYNITENKVYDIIPLTGVNQGWVMFTDDDGHTREGYDSRFKVGEDEEKGLTMEEHVAKAQELVGKTVISAKKSRFKVNVINVYLKGFTDPTVAVRILDKLKTVPYVVSVGDGMYNVDYQDCKIILDEVTVKLNEQYTAVVTKDGIKVGCQTFPVSIVEELTKAINSLK